jgi:hypothetical protein
VDKTCFKNKVFGFLRDLFGAILWNQNTTWMFQGGKSRLYAFVLIIKAKHIVFLHVHIILASATWRHNPDAMQVKREIQTQG